MDWVTRDRKVNKEETIETQLSFSDNELLIESRSILDF